MEIKEENMEEREKKYFVIKWINKQQFILKIKPLFIKQDGDSVVGFSSSSWFGYGDFFLLNSLE